MNATIRNEVPQVSPSDASLDSKQTAAKREDGEFKITVRKLEIPVRPRGVLAE